MTDQYAFDYNFPMPPVAALSQRPQPKYHGMSVDQALYKSLAPDGYRYDMVDGVLYVAASPFFRHNEIQFRFLSALSDFLGTGSSVRMVADVDVFLPDGGDVLCPDASVLLSDNPSDTSEWIEGVPDLVLEVHSPSTKHWDLGRKADRYLANGVREYWLIDPSDGKTQVWNSEFGVWKKSRSGKSRLFPGFSFQIPF
ncbi:Uma2 family endonuclease [Leptospira wolffii]|uniref:Uma2 family endonuclease n=1 Tax=Leptospira wolffii TaxID=409998 RepID=A0ABV5BQR1_9LEPT|nr:Uma2 family endonuclease [Leptospira wolffii]TGL45391.1 Uma2 family endonuclease [Leptospira wolffii]